MRAGRWIATAPANRLRESISGHHCDSKATRQGSVRIIGSLGTGW